jgi:ribosome-interacting GTPase 1
MVGPFIPSPMTPTAQEIANYNSLYVYNKIDSVSLDFLDQLAREPYTAVMSCELDLGVQEVVDRIWKELRLIRIYTKRYAPSPATNETGIDIADTPLGKEKTRISVRR